MESKTTSSKQKKSTATVKSDTKNHVVAKKVQKVFYYDNPGQVPNPLGPDPKIPKKYSVAKNSTT